MLNPFPRHSWSYPAYRKFHSQTVFVLEHAIATWTPRVLERPSTTAPFMAVTELESIVLLWPPKTARPSRIGGNEPAA
jgi:hypothetical protein